MILTHNDVSTVRNNILLLNTLASDIIRARAYSRGGGGGSGGSNIKFSDFFLKSERKEVENF